MSLCIKAISLLWSIQDRKENISTQAFACFVWVNTHTLLMQRGLGTEQTPPYAREGMRAEWSSGGCGDIPSCCNMAPLATHTTPCSPVFKCLCYYGCLRLVINVVKAEDMVICNLSTTQHRRYLTVIYIVVHSAIMSVFIVLYAVWSQYQWWQVEIKENNIFFDLAQFCFKDFLHQSTKCHHPNTGSCK